MADALLGQSPSGNLELRPSSSNSELRPSMLRPSSSNPELPPMLRPERDSVLGRAQLSPSSSASPGGSSLAIPGRSSLAIPGRSSLASPVRPSVASPVRSSLAERGRHRSFSRLCPGQIVFERTGPFQAATLLLTCRFTYSLASSRTYPPTCFLPSNAMPLHAYVTHLLSYLHSFTLLYLFTLICRTPCCG